jgi:shikimate dehydrogenase
MTHGRPPISGRTRFYGIFADPIGHVQAPAAFNALLDRRGVDAVFVPLHVPAEHFAAAVAGLRHIRSFAGYTLTMPHKAMAVRQCDALLPNARACGAVNAVRIDPDGRLIGEIYDGVGMVKAITAHRALDATTRVLLVGAGGAGRAIAVAIALAGVGSLAIANRTRDKADDLAEMVRRAVPACVVEAGTAIDPAAFDLVINAISLGLNGQGPMPVDVSRVSGTALVADVVTVPELTPLLHAAQARGLGIVCGREMLTQCVEAMADFLGMTADE